MFLHIGGVNSSTTATHSYWLRKTGPSAPPGMVGMIWNCSAAAALRLNALGTPDSFGRSMAAGLWNCVATGQSSNVHQTDLGTFTSVSARKRQASRCLGLACDKQADGTASISIGVPTGFEPLAGSPMRVVERRLEACRPVRCAASGSKSRRVPLTKLVSAEPRVSAPHPVPPEAAWRPPP
jgi:hypothetical protein